MNIPCPIPIPLTPPANYCKIQKDLIKSGKEGLFMIYLMLVCAVVIVLLLFTRSEYRTMQLMSMFLVLFFFITSLCFFILYFASLPLT